MSPVFSRLLSFATPIASALSLYVPAAGAVRAPTGEQRKPVHIIANLSIKKGEWHPTVVANFGYDATYRGTVDERLTHAWSQIKDSGALFYVRCHSVFSDSPPGRGCRIYSEDASGRPLYDWSRLDAVLDIVLQSGVRPIIVCDFMPDALAACPHEGAGGLDGTGRSSAAAASATRTARDAQIIRNYSGGDINFPKDFVKWKSLVRELVLHCERRHGQQEVRKWYFELSPARIGAQGAGARQSPTARQELLRSPRPGNEPDVKEYSIGGGRPIKYENVVRFFELYDYFAAGAKEADPRVRIGGPALGGRDIDYGFARYFLLHCVRGQNFATGKKEGSPIDFISWHAYGDLGYILDVNEKYAQLIQKEAPSLSKCQRLLDEWGEQLGSGSNWPRTHNHYEAAFAAALLREVLSPESPNVDLMVRWGGLTGEYFSGWRSLFTRIAGKTVPLAAFNLYRLLGKMSSSRVKVTVNVSDRSAGAMATAAAPNTLQLLFWRFEEGNRAGAAPERKFTVTVRGFQKRIRTVKSWYYLIDDDHCDAWSAWGRIGSPKPATPEQAEAIFRKAVLSIAGEERNIPVRRQRAIITLSLRPNSVCLLVLGKEGNARKEQPAPKQPPSGPRLPKTLLP